MRTSGEFDSTNRTSQTLLYFNGGYDYHPDYYHNDGDCDGVYDDDYDDLINNNELDEDCNGEVTVQSVGEHVFDKNWILVKMLLMVRSKTNIKMWMTLKFDIYDYGGVVCGQMFDTHSNKGINDFL